MVARPTLAWMSPAASLSKYSPGFICSFSFSHKSANGIMDSDQFCTVRKGRLDLDIVDHFSVPIHQILAAQDCCTEGHDFSHTFAIASRLHNLSSDKRNCFRVIQFKAARLALPCQFRRDKNQELILLSLGKVHRCLLLLSI